MRINYKKLIICILAPLIVGGISALISGGNMEIFEKINKPPISPPGWLFPIVWTVLYILMGIAVYLILESKTEKRDIENAVGAYGLQLFFNFFWSIIFFNFELYAFAFIWLAVLLILIIITTVRFVRISKPAGYLMIPYIIWVTFAGYLNLSIALLNLAIKKQGMTFGHSLTVFIIDI